ncbi:hypothetical protein ACLOJK_005493 [Asimina triloba]
MEWTERHATFEHCSRRCTVAVFNADDVGRRRGSLWARHAHADIADMLRTIAGVPYGAVGVGSEVGSLGSGLWAVLAMSSGGERSNADGVVLVRDRQRATEVLSTVMGASCNQCLGQRTTTSVDRDDGLHDERPGSNDPGLTDDENEGRCIWGETTVR